MEQFLSKQGLNAQSLISGGKDVTSKAEEAITYASPTVRSTANTIQATSPQILAQYAFAAIGVYYLVRLKFIPHLKRCMSLYPLELSHFITLLLRLAS